MPTASNGSAASTGSTGSASGNGTTDTTGNAAAAPAAAGSTTSTATAASTTTSLQKALSASAQLSVDGVAAAPASVAAADASPGGRHFYVDSASGDDGNDGSSATPGAPGVGPWRTLARAASAGMTPGDALVLACGGRWNETLRLPASGTAARPIVVTAATGCSTAPAIDGGTVLQPQDWTPDHGKVFRATIAAVPLALTSSAGPLLEAHHPNTPYLALAADGNTVVTNGRSGSTVLTTGPDLVLPAGATLGRGTRLRLRTNSWTLDESAVASVSSSTITLASPTSYPAKAGWGYYLLGQAWMLDSAGEWFHDAPAGRLYLWMPDSQAPAVPVVATTLATGIDLDGRSQVIVSGIAIRHVGTAVVARRSTGIQLRGLTIEDTAGRGIDLAASSTATVESCVLARIGSEGIAGLGDALKAADAVTVRNNLLREVGVVLNGDTVVTLPVRSQYAIGAGTNAVLDGNTVLDAAYHGFYLSAGSLAKGNFVYGACSVLDDCGGIYASGAGNGSTISGNAVVHSRGNASGKPALSAFTQAQGIYLDESASGIRVSDNTVVDSDNGVQIHVSNTNVIRANRLYGNRVSQLWMQATRNSVNAAGDVWGNTVDSNLIAPILPGSTGIFLQTVFATTAGFGTFDGNHFLDRTEPVGTVATSSGSRNLTFAQWQAAQGVGSTSPLDPNGSSVSGTPYAGFTVAGANLVANASLATNASGWSSWNAVAPAGQLIREACPAGICLRYVAGGSPGIIISPNFSLTAGRWYRLSVDLATQTDGQDVQLVVRRGGGGSNGYESLSALSLTQRASMSWQRFSAVFQATKTVIAHDPVTGDLGARVDIQGIDAGHGVSVANLEVVPLTPDPLSMISGVLVNAGPTSMTASCPFATSQPAACSAFHRLLDDSVTSWPIAIQPYSAMVLYTQSEALLDSDHDGIPDSQDACPGTPLGAVVNAAGCPFVVH